MITSTKYFNPNGCKILDEKIFEPKNIVTRLNTGFIDFNRPRYKWSKELYRMAMNRFWTPQQVNVSAEKKNFSLLSPNEKEIYKRVFSQLSFDDSIQTNFLIDLAPKANNQITRATIIKQAEQEIVHSDMYSFLLDNVGNSNEVFDLYKTEPSIALKNQRIADMYARYINGETQKDFLMSAMCSVCLEGVFFLTGFSYIFVMGDKIQGSSDGLAEIAIDEIVLHLPIFANIVNTIYRENYFTASVKDEMINILMEAYDIEMEYAKSLEPYPILGLTPELIQTTIENFVNDRAKILHLPLPFPKRNITPLQKLIKDRIDSRNSVKSNFFETQVKNYSVGSIDLDDF